MGYIALVIALGSGSAYALSGHNTVFSDDIAPKQVKQADVHPAQEWHEVGYPSDGPPLGSAPSGSAPTDCAWLNLPYQGSEYDHAGFYRDPYGTVRLKGFISGQFFGCSGDQPDAIFTLPRGYRPAKRTVFTVMVTKDDTHVSRRVDVLTDGRVKAMFTGGTDLSLERVSLADISFRCGPQGKNGCR